MAITLGFPADVQEDSKADRCEARNRRKQVLAADFSQAHIECAVAAMADCRDIEAEHAGAEFRKAEPQRYLAPQNAAVFMNAGASPFSGDHQHELRAVRLS